MAGAERLLKESDKFLYGEFWTAKQRQGHPIHHTVSYRASFKPELPSFFMNEFLKKKKSVVYDPFGGRGTTAIQANIEGHVAIHNDIHPLSLFLASARQNVPGLERLIAKVESLDLSTENPEEEGDHLLLPFFHPKTLNEIKNLKKYMQEDDSPEMKFIGLIALSRLHGHSTGFFSVYTFPQVSIPSEAQRKNNIKRNQSPEYREVKPRIIQKMKRDMSVAMPPFYHEFSKENIYSLSSANSVPNIASESVDLIVTSPPFLDKVDYEADNWLRHWFLDISKNSERKLSIFSNLQDWNHFIRSTLKESSRVLKKGAYMVMEVGEVKKGKEILNLDEDVVNMAQGTGLVWSKTYIHTQTFTKLSNCWQVSNNEKGTNSNRCVVLRKAN
ncbi:site-specific DNA-methyltransferase [Leptospira idonii]|uniref:site-specific DNA-methyltransferase (cytosine-N(4)-specific) n=1 Tax=Leptospira idonii TaxID=1193500 RepID=A0A4R9M5X5_9LEPT|nr:site-specific DNA-methyltransferase [Leptospira idonii]TGN20118.1 site-specific DNA-methyltransferase [Leptospira idonii]